MAEARDRVEIGGVERGEEARSGSPRPFLGLHFTCSGQYSRASKTADGTAYMGRCPKCAKCVRFAIGSGGTSRRFFEVSCRG